MIAPLFSRLEKIWITVIGCSICLVSTVAVVFHDVDNSERIFQQQMDRHVSEISQRIGNAEAALTALVGLFHATDHIDSSELTAFAQEILSAYPYLQAVLYLPMVEERQRQAFEKKMQSAGFPQFKIWNPEISSESQEKTTRRLPISFFEPLDPLSVQLIGLNAIEHPGLRTPIETAISTGAITLSRPLAFPEGFNGQYLFKAVYKGYYTPESQSERRDQLHGLIALQISENQLLGSKLMSNPNLDLRISSQSTRSGSLDVLFESFSRSHSQSNRFLPELEYTGTLNLPGQRMFLEASTRFNLASIRFWLIGIISLLLILLLISVVIGISNRRIARIREQDAQEEIFKQKERAEVTLHSIGDAVITTDLDARLEYMNPVAEKLIGLKTSARKGSKLSSLFTLINEQDGEPIASPIVESLAHGRQSLSEEYALLRTPDGNSVAVHHSAAPIHDRTGNLIGAVVVLRDVSMERHLASQMAYQASHDALTGLVNRREFEHQLTAVLEDARHKHSMHSVCYLDLDQFKLVNDTAGHIAGDKLLKQIASHFQLHIRKTDVLARLGGDEFGLLLKHCPPDRALHVAKKLCQELKDMSFHWEDKVFNVGVSIGIVNINQNSGSLAEVLSSADSACFTAKDLGRDQAHVYQADDVVVTRRRGEMLWVQRIKTALTHDQFVLCLQDICPVNPGYSSKKMGEFLLRLRKENDELVAPMAFIPAAERYNLVRDIDLWVIKRALAVIGSRQKTFPYEECIYTINLSGQSLDNPKLPGYVESNLNEYDVDPSNVCFEITETAVIADLNQAVTLMVSLKKIGCRFALDDFGTGLSSFAYLKKLPVDYLKIDGEFVRDVKTDPVDQAMVETINNIGHVLGIITIAEAVEDAAVMGLLTDMGVDYVQGYHVGRPQPVCCSPLSKLTQTVSKDGAEVIEG